MDKAIEKLLSAKAAYNAALYNAYNTEDVNQREADQVKSEYETQLINTIKCLISELERVRIWGGRE